MSCDITCIVISSCFLVVTIIMIIGGNLLVGVTVYQVRSMRTVTNMFVVNLAVCDLLNAVFNCPLMLISIFAKGWILGAEMCRISGFLNVVFCCASILTLTAISVDRYFCITKPTKKVITKPRALRITAGVWIIVVLLAVVPLIGWNSYGYIDDRKHCMISWNMGGKHFVYGIFLSSVSFVVPTWVMVFCYYHIFKTARTQAKKFTRTAVLDKRHAWKTEARLSPPRILSTSSSEEQKNETNTDEIARARRERRTARTILIVIGVFQICWLPYAALNLWSAFSANSPPGPADLWVSLLAYFNSACNPIIYTIFNHRFRQGFKQVLQCRKNNSIHAVTDSLKCNLPLARDISRPRGKERESRETNTRC